MVKLYDVYFRLKTKPDEKYETWFVPGTREEALAYIEMWEKIHNQYYHWIEPVKEDENE